MTSITAIERPVMAVDVSADAFAVAEMFLPTPVLICVVADAQGDPLRYVFYYLDRFCDDAELRGQTFADPVTGDPIVEIRRAEGSELDDFWTVYAARRPAAGRA